MKYLIFFLVTATDIYNLPKKLKTPKLKNVFLSKDCKNKKIAKYICQIVSPSKEVSTQTDLETIVDEKKLALEKLLELLSPNRRKKMFLWLLGFAITGFNVFGLCRHFNIPKLHKKSTPADLSVGEEEEEVHCCQNYLLNQSKMFSEIKKIKKSVIQVRSQLTKNANLSKKNRVRFFKQQRRLFKQLFILQKRFDLIILSLEQFRGAAFSHLESLVNNSEATITSNHATLFKDSFKELMNDLSKIQKTLTELTQQRTSASESGLLDFMSPSTNSSPSKSPASKQQHAASSQKQNNSWASLFS